MAESNNYIEEMIIRARRAQAQIEYASQKKVDDVEGRIAWSMLSEKFIDEVASMAVKESQMGRMESKKAKMRTKVKGVYRDIKNAKTVGILEKDDKRGIVKIAKPVGVIGGLIPVTNCEATPACKALSAIKCRNAIILAPHPRAVETGKFVTNRIRAVLARHNWPEDLVQCVEKVSVENSRALMAQCDLILATGGGPMVKAAYSSGKPALGVGDGNAVTIIDVTADTDQAAEKIMLSNTFDWATSCSTENACLVHENIYSEMKISFDKSGGYLVPADEKNKLQNALWPDGIHLNKYIVAQHPKRIAEIAGITIPEDKKFFVVEEHGIGPGYPFTGEKLSACLAMYKWNNFNQAIDMVNRITEFSGPGHSCGIHTADNEKVMKLGEKVKASRIMVNQPQCLSNAGSWTNGMPMTLTLGCGTWGGNISSDNIDYKKLLNTTWISWPIEGREPSDEELFGKEIREEVWD